MMKRLLHSEAFTGQRVLIVIVSFFILLSAMMTGTFAWEGLTNAINQFLRTNKGYSAELHKYERNSDETAAEIYLDGAEFLLFKIHIDGSQEQIGDVYTTENGKIRVEGLSPGNYYFLEQLPPYGYTYDEEEGREKIRYDFTITSDGDKEVFVSAWNRRLTSEVSVTKALENADGTPLTEEQEGATFCFYVEFRDGDTVTGPFSYFLNDDRDTIYELEEGKWLYMKHGDKVTFIDVPVGTLCTVTETGQPGYIISSDNNQINVLLMEDMEEQDMVIAFYNSYRESWLELEKEVKPDGDPEKEFEFTILFEDEDDKGYTYTIGEEIFTVKNGDTITLKHGQKARFENLPVGLRYKIIEKEYQNEGYIPDYDTIEGEVLEFGSLATFINNYGDAKAGELQVEKGVAGEWTEEQLEQEFTLRVVFSDGNSYRYEKDGEEFELEETGIFYLIPGERVIFKDLPPGITYVVEELDIPEGFTALNRKVHGVIAADYSAAVVLYNAAGQETGDEPGDLIVSKEITGNMTAEDLETEFRFRLNFSDDVEITEVRYQIVRPDGSISEELQLDEDQVIILRHGERAVFTKLSAGTAYEVEELGDYEGYVIRTNYQAGTIAAGHPAEAAFKNHKQGEKDTGSLEISKEVTGAEAGEEPFSFVITFDDGESYQYLLNGEGEPRSLVEGRLELKAGEFVRFLNIPDGTGYHVTEMDKDGYRAEQSTFAGVVRKDGVVHLPFVNHKLGETTIIIEKIVEGIETDKKFKFRFYCNGEMYEFELGHGERKEFVVPEGAEYELWEEDYYRDGYVQTGVTSGTGTADGARITITKTNTYTPSIIKRTSVSVEKVWAGYEDLNQPSEIYVQLFREGEPYGMPIPLSEWNSWQHTWTGLNAGYEWTVDEAEVLEGYEKVITGDAINGFTITNTNTDETKGIPEEPGDNGTDGGADHNRGSNGSKESSSGPKTGDTKEVWFWCLMLVANAIVLRHLLFYEKRS